MSDADVFKELSSSLSEKERKELLDRISTSINLDNNFEDRIYKKEITQSERDEMIKNAVEDLGWFQRLILWIRSKLSDKKISEVYVLKRINDIKRSINKRNPGLTGFETRNLTPKIALAFYNLFTETTPLREMYKNLWLQVRDIEAAFTSIIELRLDNVKKNLTDLITIEEMQDIYAERRSKHLLRESITSRIDNYIASIPDQWFSHIEEIVLPIFYLKDIVLFPYTSFFQLFGYTPLPGDQTPNPPFKNASAMLTIDYLEKMYYAVYSAAQIEENVSIDSNLIDFMILLNTERSDEHGDSEGSQEDQNRQTAYFEKKIKSIVREAKNFHRKIPVAEIIRYFIKDPFYKIVVKLPQIYLKDFYHSVLKMRFLSQVDTIFPEVQENYVKSEINKLFRDTSLVPFQHYREYASIDHESTGLPFFKHTRSLNLLYNYIRSFYRVYIRDAVEILERGGFFGQNQIARERMINYTGMIEDLEDKIKSFDYSLSADAEEGKIFQRLRYSLAQDPTHQKMYRSMVIQKDREVKSLLDKGKESTLGLQRIFIEMLENNTQSMRVQLSNHYFIKGKPIKLEDLLKTRAKHLKDFVELYDQLLKIEKG